MPTEQGAPAQLTDKERIWHAHLSQCDASGMSMRAYAAEHGLNVSTLYFYRKRLRARLSPGGAGKVTRPGKPRFVRAVASATLPCRVHLSNGMTVEIGVGVDELAPLLRRLNTSS